ncbi:MAG: PrsW family glutamic-type intramembrane protease [Bacillota bacterium]
MYFYKKDKYDPEPKSIIIRDFIWGLFLVFPVSFLEAPFSSFLSSDSSLLTIFLASIFIVGLFEEGIKAYVVYKFHYGHPEFNERIDGIIYGITVGLGFAAAENLLYTISYGYQVGIIRAFITTLAHASFTGVFGYFLAKAYIENKRSCLYVGLFLAVLLHGLYDFLLLSEIIGIGYTILIIIGLQLLLSHLMNIVLEKSPFKNLGGD